MSFAAIIIGLLVWFSTPPLFRTILSKDNYPILQQVCKWIGIAIIVGGILYGFFK